MDTGSRIIMLEKEVRALRAALRSVEVRDRLEVLRVERETLEAQAQLREESEAETQAVIDSLDRLRAD